MRFVGNAEMAHSLYETGRKLNPKSYVLLTNLARSLIKQGDKANLSLAQRYLTQAAQYSRFNDRAFVWWRDVQSKLNEALGQSRKLQTRKSIADTAQNLNFKDVQQRFWTLQEGIYELSERGLLFEAVFRDLLKLTFGPEVVYGSHHVDVGGSRQVDAAFRWQNAYYRVETKWHERPIGPDKFDVFRTILKTAEVRGLFISMSGFTDGAIANAHEIGKDRTIILIDGSEVEDIFKGNSRLDILIDKKLDAFQRTGNPFGPTKGST